MTADVTNLPAFAEARRAQSIDILWRTVWGEARGEGRNGMAAVACVVLNRAEIGRLYSLKHDKPHPLYGRGDITDVCLKFDATRPWIYQFSCWSPEDPNRQKMLSLSVADDGAVDALEVAQDAVDGKLQDITGGATHYHAVPIPKGVAVWPPVWASKMGECARIGRHVFYDERRPPGYQGPATGPEGPTNGGTPVAARAAEAA